jgi:hypothetical protein
LLSYTWLNKVELATPRLLGETALLIEITVA